MSARDEILAALAAMPGRRRLPAETLAEHDAAVRTAALNEGADALAGMREDSRYDFRQRVALSFAETRLRALAAAGQAPAPQPETAPDAPAVGDRYDCRHGGEGVTVTRLWSLDNGHPAVDFEWHDGGASALPLDSFRRAYRPETAPDAEPGTPDLRERIRALHREVDGSPHAEGSCLEDGQDYPCATLRALDQPDPWQAIADALNAAPGGILGIDLDGTITDHDEHSVIWDREAERWVVAAYDEDEDQAPAGEPTQPDADELTPEETGERENSLLYWLGPRKDDTPPTDETVHCAAPGCPRKALTVAAARRRGWSRDAITHGWYDPQCADGRQERAELLANLDAQLAGEPKRHSVLGEFVGCGRPHCRNAEWEMKAPERGWSEQGDGTWACPECMEAAERGDDR